MTSVLPTSSPARMTPVRAALAVSATAALVGWIASAWAGAHLARRMLPWVLGRGLGLGGYVALVALTAMGLWLRHPWRRRRRLLGPLRELRVHAVLAAMALVLVAGHVVALALDRYAGVGWTGAFVPGRATYRPLAVAWGTAALYLGLLVGLTAALAGRLVVRRAWLPVHRLASVAFVLVWLHAVLAGTDTPRLRVAYAVSGLAVAALALSRRVATPHTVAVPVRERGWRR